MDAPPPPPGWYPDPQNRRRQRFWNGGEWTEYDRDTPRWRGSGSQGKTWQALIPALVGIPVVLLAALVAIGIVANAISSNDPMAEATAASPTPSTAAPTTVALVPVPGIRGRSRTDARRALAEAGLRVGRVVRRPSARPVGTVLEQHPAMGRVLPGTSIALVVAAPLPRAPDVVGLLSARARHLVRRTGFVVVLRTRTVSSGTDHSILEQHPAAGTPLRPGASITLVVADVHAPALVQTNCTPGYSPCLTPASDYDCAGGSGNGPEYVYGTEVVTGSDPYELDSDGDGYGCE